MTLKTSQSKLYTKFLFKYLNYLSIAITFFKANWIAEITSLLKFPVAEPFYFTII